MRDKVKPQNKYGNVSQRRKDGGSETGQRFELDSLFDDNRLVPCYMPDDHQLLAAETIQQAIEKYQGQTSGQQELSESLYLITEGTSLCWMSGRAGMGRRTQKSQKDQT